MMMGFTIMNHSWKMKIEDWLKGLSRFIKNKMSGQRQTLKKATLDLWHTWQKQNCSPHNGVQRRRHYLLHHMLLCETILVEET